MAAESHRVVAPTITSGEIFEVEWLGSGHDFSGKPYLEFLRTASLSAGLYKLAAGASDPQRPHTEDEVYHVLEGAAHLWVGEGNLPVGAGSVAFVSAGVEHCFHSIEEDLKVLVVFAPAEHSLASGAAGEPSDAADGACT